MSRAFIIIELSHHTEKFKDSIILIYLWLTKLICYAEGNVYLKLPESSLWTDKISG